ncbi:MAG: DASS family sodium-coupled anion symporter [Candidatus Marinimicrobia bacterium]|nr:DASS family sodium-coupled anion symporter [Candidatus Neomarinimicrobiota bacterium]MBT3618035.1 DASS family sodium-coupled anion symporter [Candidatus Neomarinimicrobiota bacterium]MBT3828508.1 DASS family sodium-coupled anion symporter [Candidatus Neomarinimicrobiota bacterium]MBT3998021.1 DASS family sodium-coupled anion symporter [Candidatus Neomarinimicrobiota bacterium]MBT4280275.1 DASS family sodium-coupled anion symporter [Candidatus Neomarinimicrobiota bacterium]
MRNKLGLIIGISVFALLLLLPPPQGMDPNGMRAAAVSALMAIFWITEAIPIFATAFIPIALFPLLGILNAKDIAGAYGHHIVLLILGAFFVARAIEANQLHKRIALGTIKLIGTSRQRIVLSFMIATALLSMWTSNNSTTLMMLPIGLAIIQHEKTHGSSDPGFSAGLMLAIAYSASIGGTGTLVGTPPNLQFVSTMKEIFPDSPEVVFLDWMKIGIPFVIVFLPIAWFYLIKYFRIEGGLSGSDKIIDDEYKALGRMSTAEKRVALISVLYALGFIFRRNLIIGDMIIPGWSDVLGVESYTKDATVAFLAAFALFILPTGSKKGTGHKKRLLEWKDAQSIPWGIPMLIGGGLAIASAFRESGLVSWIGNSLDLTGIPIFVVILIIVACMVFLTEINSNAATAAVFLPILAGLSKAGGFHPFLLMVPATIAASCAFMLPSGTGPNASILASGHVSIPEMAKCGFGLNFLAIVVIVLLIYFVIIPVFGLANNVPVWMNL